ncbi:hypothetical protein AYI68_g7760 [Smittium mucronatum]|uniref:Uncharacterized protein n=1 Tax=Smittium mucronatum TaxID=133383 RepID=A0A1R0GMS3_9FUNG|nr:hypothetical protein AYI68_g7760 [Smittium mucronatum]
MPSKRPFFSTTLDLSPNPQVSHYSPKKHNSNSFTFRGDLSFNPGSFTSAKPNTHHHFHNYNVDNNAPTENNLCRSTTIPFSRPATNISFKNNNVSDYDHFCKKSKTSSSKAPSFPRFDTPIQFNPPPLEYPFPTPQVISHCKPKNPDSSLGVVPDSWKQDSSCAPPSLIQAPQYIHHPQRSLKPAANHTSSAPTDYFHLQNKPPPNFSSNYDLYHNNIGYKDERKKINKHSHEYKRNHGYSHPDSDKNMCDQLPNDNSVKIVLEDTPLNLPNAVGFYSRDLIGNFDSTIDTLGNSFDYQQSFLPSYDSFPSSSNIYRSPPSPILNPSAYSVPPSHNKPFSRVSTYLQPNSKYNDSFSKSYGPKSGSPNLSKINKASITNLVSNYSAPLTSTNATDVSPLVAMHSMPHPPKNATVSPQPSASIKEISYDNSSFKAMSSLDILSKVATDDLGEIPEKSLELSSSIQEYGSVPSTDTKSFIEVCYDYSKGDDANPVLSKSCKVSAGCSVPSLSLSPKTLLCGKESSGISDKSVKNLGESLDTRSEPRETRSGSVEISSESSETGGELMETRSESLEAGSEFLETNDESVESGGVLDDIDYKSLQIPKDAYEEAVEIYNKDIRRDMQCLQSYEAGYWDVLQTNEKSIRARND